MRVVFTAVIVALSVPGIVAPLYDPNAGWDWLWTDKLADDHAKYTSGNMALMAVVDGLQAYLDQQDEPLHVVAPGIKRLPFFFPLEDIRTDEMPTRLDELDGVTYFIYGTPETGGDFDTIPAGSNQVLNALSLATDDPNDSGAIMRRAWGYDDGIFKYTVYELNLENRWIKPAVGAPAEADVVLGGFVRFLGFDIGGLELWPGRRVVMHLYWEVLEQPEADYTVFIHLRDAEDNLWATWDGPVTRTGDGNYYSTLVWEAGETITDERRIGLDSLEMPTGDGYRIVIGLYDPATETRATVSVDGEPAGDSYIISDRITIQAQAP